MIRWALSAFIIVIAGGWLAAGAGDDAKLMEGTWSGTVLESNGKPPPPDEKKVKVRLVVKGGKWTAYFDDKVVTEGNIKVDATKKPKHVDAEHTGGEYKGSLQLGIYELTKDEMKVVFGGPGKERPTDFKTGKEQVMLLYKRAKEVK